MGQEEKRVWDTEAERRRKAEYRERKRLEQAELSELREQEIRDSFGYAPSETRSKAERDAVAARIMAKAAKAGPLAGFPARPNDLRPSEAQLRKLGR